MMCWILNFLQICITEANLNLIWDLLSHLTKSYLISSYEILNGIVKFDNPLSGLLPSNQHLQAADEVKKSYFTMKITFCKKKKKKP